MKISAMLVLLAACSAAAQQTVQVSGALTFTTLGVSETVQINGTFNGSVLISGSGTPIPAPPPPPIVVGPSACTPFTDPLTGASGTAMNSANWSPPTGFALGGGSVVQNAGVAQANAAYRGGGTVLMACPQSLAPYVQFTVSAVDGLNTLQGLISTTAAGNGYAIGISNTGGNNGVAKCTAGVCKFLGYASCSAAFAPASVFKASAVIVPGTSIAISVYQNGVLCGTVTDTASPYTNGYSGFAIYANKVVAGDQISQLTALD